MKYSFKEGHMYCLCCFPKINGTIVVVPAVMYICTRCLRITCSPCVFIAVHLFSQILSFLPFYTPLPHHHFTPLPPHPFSYLAVPSSLLLPSLFSPFLFTLHFSPPFPTLPGFPHSHDRKTCSHIIRDI